jgi:hypothetical protein
MLKRKLSIFLELFMRFLGITILPSEKSTLCYFNHLSFIKQLKWPFAVEDEPKGKGHGPQEILRIRSWAGL